MAKTVPRVNAFGATRGSSSPSVALVRGGGRVDVASRRLAITLFVAACTAVSFAVSWAMSPGADRSREIVVYGFSTQQEVMTLAVFPAFEEWWGATTGESWNVRGVFGPSRAIAGQINLGAPADVALFSNAHDADWLRLGRRVQKVEAVMYATSPIVIVTRPGNPRNIRSFADLALADLVVVHPDPLQSGAGAWAVLAEYGSVVANGGTREEAVRQLGALWRNVEIAPDSARTAMSLFELGAGDALPTYEADARLAQARGAALEIVMPASTIVARHVAVVIDANVKSAERAAVQAFVAFLTGPRGARELARYHMRPTDRTAAGTGGLDLHRTFDVDDLGGWAEAYDTVIARVWIDQIAPRMKLDEVTVSPATIRDS